MIRLFVQESLKENQEIILREKQSHYLRHVMRLQEGDEVHLFNGKDGLWSAKLSFLNKKETKLQVEAFLKEQKMLKPCGLAFALIKKENMDLVLQKATELGVTDLYPLLTQYTVVRQFNEQRALLILTEAAEQCERLDVPVLHPLKNLEDFLACLPGNFTPVYLAERAHHTEKLDPDCAPLFFVGPEGGFSPRENQLLENQPNMKTLHLGETILRAETASLAVLSAWQFRLF